MKQSKEQGVQVVFAEPISQDENTVAIALLYYAKTHPDIVADKKMMSCKEVGIPGQCVARLLGKEKDRDMDSLPADVFANILDKCLKAKLVCRLVDKKGKLHTYTAPYLPVMYFTEGDDLWFSFTEQPQCWFDRVETDPNAPYFQLKPLGGLLDFMREMAKEYK